ncbi:hypothetical protein [Nocardioides sp.]|uniref:hypothetical protein n=1 Tax=Nocardioides sp. TaxID=35761 RepID=UPI0035133412
MNPRLGPSRISRPLVALGLGTVLAAGLTACGGSDVDSSTSAPEGASKKEYCEAAEAVFGGDALTDAVKSKDWDKLADRLHDGAKNLEEVGTPDGISKEARDGFAIQVNALKKIEAGDLEKAFEKPTGDPFDLTISKADQEKAQTYLEYQLKTCPPKLPSMPSDLPTDLPSLPSDLPTDLPSDLASQLGDIPTDPAELQSYLDDLQNQ